MAALRFARNKYKAKPTNGFPSKLESALNDHLQWRRLMKEITNIKRQQPVTLVGGIRWKVDFSYELIETGETIYAEAKGVETADYRVKLKLWRAQPPATLEIWKGSHKRLVLKEVIKKEVK